MIRSDRRFRFELIPVRGIEARFDELPASIAATVTSSPKLGLERTLRYTELLRERDIDAVPHLSARHIRDLGHLREIVERLRAAGVRDVFVIGGDGDDIAGSFKTGVELIEALGEVSHDFERVGIAAYPEGHPAIGAQELVDTLRRKQVVATYIVTQMCFNAATVVEWLRRVRADGIHLPVFVGVAGAVRTTKLVTMALRLGVGQSARFLSKQHGLAHLLGPRTYRPDRFVSATEGLLTTDDAGIAGYQIFTFNEIGRTVRRLPMT